MLLSYETSSLAYDNIDLVHGMFVPATVPTSSNCPCPLSLCARHQRPVNKPVTVFINIYGVFADLTGRFAKHYDEHVIPCVTECILDPDYIYENIPKVGVEAMMEEDEFWIGMKAYPWYLLLMQELYNVSKGNYYFILPLMDGNQLDDRFSWVWRHFGNSNKERTILIERTAAEELLIDSRNDVLLSADLRRCEDWSKSGGSAFWWPEIDIGCQDPAKILSKRVNLFGKVLDDLRELSQEPMYDTGSLPPDFVLGGS